MKALLKHFEMAICNLQLGGAYHFFPKSKCIPPTTQDGKYYNTAAMVAQDLGFV